MIAHLGLHACLCSLRWDNVEACKAKGSCKLLGSLRWPSPLCSTSQPKGKVFAQHQVQLKYSWVRQGKWIFLLLSWWGLVGFPHGRWRAGPVWEGYCPCSVTHNAFLVLFPASFIPMLLVLGSTVGAWMGTQMGVWGWGLALVDRQTSSLNLHKPCVCSGDGLLLLFGQKPQCKTQVWWAACEETLPAPAQSVCWERQACRPACWALKNTLHWPEKRFVCEILRLQTSVIAMLLERTGILEERIFVQVYFGNYWSNTRTKPHPVTVSISGVTEV